MICLIGEKKNRDAFLSTHNLPATYYVEQIDDDVIMYHDEDDERATLYIHCSDIDYAFTIQHDGYMIGVELYADALACYDAWNNKAY